MATYPEARVREWKAEWLAEGIEQGRTEERALLCRMVERRFGEETAGRLASLPEGLVGEELLRVGEWIIKCKTGTDLLSHVGRGAESGGNGKKRN